METAQEEERERQEAEKKKLKMKDFNDNSAVADFIILQPTTYALNKLEAFKYVELWYFTQEGCIDMMECQRSQNDNAFGIIWTGDTCYKNSKRYAGLPLLSYLSPWTSLGCSHFYTLFFLYHMHSFLSQG